jgi:CBS domain-containing protein
MLVKQLLEKRSYDLFTVAPDQTVGELIEVLNERHVGAMVVVDADGVLQGIVSERAVLRLAYDKKSKTVDCKKKISDIMRKRGEISTVTMNTRVREVMELMQKERTRHMIVVDERDKAITCLSIRDIVEKLLATVETENRELQNFMYGY